MTGHHKPLLSRQPCRTDPQPCQADPSPPIERGVQSCVKTFLLRTENHPQNVPPLIPKMHHGTASNSQNMAGMFYTYCRSIFLPQTNYEWPNIRSGTPVVSSYHLFPSLRTSPAPTKWLNSPSHPVLFYGFFAWPFCARHSTGCFNI